MYEKNVGKPTFGTTENKFGPTQRLGPGASPIREAVWVPWGMCNISVLLLSHKTSFLSFKILLYERHLYIKKLF